MHGRAVWRADTVQRMYCAVPRMPADDSPIRSPFPMRITRRAAILALPRKISIRKISTSDTAILKPLAKEKVLYPFGFGLSYTSFATESSLLPASGKICAPNELPSSFEIRTTVTNTGSRSGKEIVQIYIEAPQGALGKPLRQLCGFAKTKELAPNEQDLLSISVIPYSFASYDDSGASGYPHCYVLEAGTYHFYAGANVRDAVPVGSFSLTETKVLEKLSQAMAPIHPFTRLHPKQNADGTFSTAFENAPLRAVSPAQKRKNALPDCLAVHGRPRFKAGRCQKRKLYASGISRTAFRCRSVSFYARRGHVQPESNARHCCCIWRRYRRSAALRYSGRLLFGGPSGIRMDCGASAFAFQTALCLPAPSISRSFALCLSLRDWNCAATTLMRCSGQASISTAIH